MRREIGNDVNGLQWVPVNHKEDCEPLRRRGNCYHRNCWQLLGSRWIATKEENTIKEDTLSVEDFMVVAL